MNTESQKTPNLSQLQAQKARLSRALDSCNRIKGSLEEQSLQQDSNELVSAAILAIKIARASEMTAKYKTQLQETDSQIIRVSIPILERLHKKGFVDDEIFQFWQSKLPKPEIKQLEAVVKLDEPKPPAEETAAPKEIVKPKPIISGPRVAEDNRIPRTTPEMYQRWFDIQMSLREGDPDVRLWGQDQFLWDFQNNFDRYILMEDDDILILNKPPGINSHFGHVIPVGIEEVARFNRTPETRVAHRLDRSVTGAMIIAKTRRAYSNLREQFHDKEESNLKKIYLAVLDGEFNAPDTVTVDILMAKAEKDLMRMITQDEADEHPEIHTQRALSYFRSLFVLGTSIDTSRTLAEIRIITGRQHQIRVSAAHLGFPITGDILYNPLHTRIINRTLLHAFEITFYHPRTGKSVTQRAPVPDDMRAFLNTMNLEYSLVDDQIAEKKDLWQ